ncbi:MAG: VOC family protein [Pseudomonadota bacterium]
MTGRLEHVNVTVKDPDATARLMRELFDWQVRWSGPSIHGGYTVHIGTDTDYIALYRPNEEPAPHKRRDDPAYDAVGHLAHIGIVVDDLDAVEARVKATGFTPFNHGGYDPGRRFYFLDKDDIEYEVVSYA